jgi:hypothetical protein
VNLERERERVREREIDEQTERDVCVGEMGRYIKRDYMKTQTRAYKEETEIFQKHTLKSERLNRISSCTVENSDQVSYFGTRCMYGWRENECVRVGRVRE